jgi:hypothetical protein
MGRTMYALFVRGPLGTNYSVFILGWHKVALVWRRAERIILPLVGAGHVNRRVASTSLLMQDVCPRSTTPSCPITDIEMASARQLRDSRGMCCTFTSCVAGSSTQRTQAPRAVPGRYAEGPRAMSRSYLE